MSRMGKNARTSVDPSFATGRLGKAKAFHEAAKASADRLQEGAMDRGPVVNNAVMAAIAYTDAVTIISDGKVNKGEHKDAASLLSECVGKDIRTALLADFKNLLAMKDEVQYGARYTSAEMAAKSLDQLERVNEWAIAWLQDKGVK